MSVFRLPTSLSEPARKTSDRRYARRAYGFVLALALLVVGCTNTPPDATAGASDVHSPTAKQPSPVSAHALLLYARRLAATTPDGREAAVRSARDQVDRNPAPLAYAHLALALAAPKQRLYTPDEAARFASMALDAEPGPWSPDAVQYLSDMARLLRLATAQDTDDQARIQQLETRLAGAQAKLDALSDIEEQIDSHAAP